MKVAYSDEHGWHITGIDRESNLACHANGITTRRLRDRERAEQVITEILRRRRPGRGYTHIPTGARS